MNRAANKTTEIRAEIVAGLHAKICKTLSKNVTLDDSEVVLSMIDVAFESGLLNVRESRAIQSLFGYGAEG